jgi:hypothetical protein
VRCCADVASSKCSMAPTAAPSLPSPVPTPLPSELPTPLAVEREPGCTASNCRDLGWFNAEQFGDPDVCGESESVVSGKCSGPLTFTAARRFCQASGARLCTADELLIDEARETVREMGSLFPPLCFLKSTPPPCLPQKGLSYVVPVICILTCTQLFLFYLSVTRAATTTTSWCGRPRRPTAPRLRAQVPVAYSTRTTITWLPLGPRSGGIPPCTRTTLPASYGPPLPSCAAVPPPISAPPNRPRNPPLCPRSCRRRDPRRCQR